VATPKRDQRLRRRIAPPLAVPDKAGMPIPVVDPITIEQQDHILVPERLMTSRANAGGCRLAMRHMPPAFEFAPGEQLSFGARVTAVVFSDRRPFLIKIVPNFGARRSNSGRMHDFEVV
jgi:hypothetical protein